MFSCEIKLTSREPCPNKVRFKLLQHSEFDFDSLIPIRNVLSPPTSAVPQPHSYSKNSLLVKAMHTKEMIS